ncbi:MAG TPA: pyridoxamine 5'-phosphate oxidase family protein [Mycobacteriales bacterium]|nr:pyridoxamine 5'-phosphate oxidase family protein [Mycobacteriales bacterium]
MATWEQFEAEAAGLAAAVRARLEAARHHVLATLRRDGSPRVSGIEVRFAGPDLVLGSMWGAMKAGDLRRDGRFALHSNPGDGSMSGGDARVSGRAVEVLDPGALAAFADAVDPPSRQFHLFRLDIGEVVLVSVDEEQERLLVDLWRPGGPARRFTRGNGPEPPAEMAG